MGLFSAAKLFGMTIRESANDGSDFTNPDADYRRLFLGEDGLLHLKDSSGTVTDVGSGGSGSITASGYTQNTARLLGRTTASAGAIEEITVGSGLSLSAGSLTATGSSGGLLAVKYNTTGGTKTTTSATQADIDATNAAVTFTAPASGNVLVRITASVQLPNNNVNAFFGIREGTTDLVNGSAGTFIMQGQTATAQEVLVAWVGYVSGISGGSHTYKASFSVNGGITLSVRQAANQPLVMEVWAAP